MGEANSEFPVFPDEIFTGRCVAERSIERARKRAAGKHLFHDVAGNFGKVALDGPEDVFPELTGGAFAFHAEHGQKFGPVNDCVFGVAGGLRQHFREPCRVEVPKHFAVGFRCHGGASGCGFEQASVRDGLERRDFHFHNGDVRVRAFLDVDEADLDGSAVKARDGTAAVQEEVVQKVLGVVGRDSFLDLVKDLCIVLVVGVRLFGNH